MVDILEQKVNKKSLFKRHSELLYTIANGISPHDNSFWVMAVLDLFLRKLMMLLQLYNKITRNKKHSLLVSFIDGQYLAKLAKKKTRFRLWLFYKAKCV